MPWNSHILLLCFGTIIFTICCSGWCTLWIWWSNPVQNICQYLVFAFKIFLYNWFKHFASMMKSETIFQIFLTNVIEWLHVKPLCFLLCWYFLVKTKNGNLIFHVPLSNEWNKKLILYFTPRLINIITFYTCGIQYMKQPFDT